MNFHYIQVHSIYKYYVEVKPKYREPLSDLFLDRQFGPSFKSLQKLRNLANMSEGIGLAASLTIDKRTCVCDTKDTEGEGEGKCYTPEVYHGS